MGLGARTSREIISQNTDRIAELELILGRSRRYRASRVSSRSSTLEFFLALALALGRGRSRVGGGGHGYGRCSLSSTFPAPRHSGEQREQRRRRRRRWTTGMIGRSVF